MTKFYSRVTISPQVFLFLVILMLSGVGLAQVVDPPLAINQPTTSFAAERYTYGEDGIATAAQVTLVRDIAVGDSIVNVSFPGSGTATAGNDYTGTTISITFSGNELTKTINIPIIQDNIVELNETFDLVLSSVSNSNIGIQKTATCVILNDDQAIITLTGADVIEGDSGTPKMVFTATMDKEVDVPVTAMVVTSGLNATNGVDFRSKSGSITVTTSGTLFEIEIIPDNLAEIAETIMFTVQKRNIEASGRNVILRNGVNGFIGMYRILDDDFAPVAADDGHYNIVEGETLTVKSSLGLLVNDTDEDDGRGKLSALLKSNPSRGNLVLNNTGSFSYTPRPDFFGTDSFTYAASDGTNESSTKTVTINVREQIDIEVGVDLLQHVMVTGGDAIDVFRVTVTNHGPSDASNLLIGQNQDFPNDILITSAIPSTGNFDRGQWRLNLAERATATLTLTLKAGAEAIGGTNAILCDFSFLTANQPEVNTVNNNASARASIIKAADTRASITVAPKINLQSGLFVSKITIRNLNSEPIPAFRLYVKNLPPDVQVYNAYGTRTFGTPLANLPYLLYNQPLAASADVTLTAEFFRPSLDPGFTPQYEIELIPAPETQPISIAGNIPVTRSQMLSNSDYLIEIASTPGAVYAVEYSHDMSTWTRVTPTVTAPANRLQWIDHGPPKTMSHPSTVSARYYRFALISNPR